MRAYFAALTCGDGYRPFVRRPGWQAKDPRDGDRVLLLDAYQTWPLPNVWLGVSVEDQARADERIPDLLAIPAAVRWISAEPLLGPVGLTVLRKYNPRREPWIDALRGIVTRGGLPASPNECGFNISSAIPGELPSLDWVVVGGESGPGSRPMHPDWARSLRDQCAEAGVPFLFKQWGEWSPVRIEGDEDGHLDAAYPMNGCSDPATHKSGQECLFWQGAALVQWPYIETLPAIGVRLVGKKAGGRLIDGVEHNGYPEERS